MTMVGFWITASLMIAAALAFVLPPLVGRMKSADASRDGANLTIYRERRSELEAEHAAGRLDAAQLAAARAELDRELLRDMDDTDATSPEGGPRSPYPAIVVAVLLPVLAFGLYLRLGTPQVLMGATPAPGPARAADGARPPAAAAAGQELPHSVEEMVARLEARMQAEPADPEGWLMLGRSYAAMNRLEDAQRALREADRRRPDHPLTMVALAEVMAGMQGNRLDGEPLRLVQRALELEPTFARALWLAGVHAFNVGDRAAARTAWERLLAIEGLSPQAAAQVRNALAQTTDAGTVPSSQSSSAAAPAPPAPESGAQGAGVELTVNVSLAPELTQRMDGNETLFVFARAAAGPRMPLAIARHQANELPLTVTLNDSMAMTPQMTLSRFDQVVVGARISRSGNATPSGGDLEGTSAPLSPRDAAAVNVVIDKVVP